MLRPPVVALLIVPEIPSLAGVYKLSEVWPRAAGSTRGDSRRPPVAELAVVSAIAALGGAAALEVAMPMARAARR
jgi:hypothetical protein